MVIGHFDGSSDPRSAQGPKSREFHFSARMCANCNGNLTQPADREFDRFQREAVALAANGDAPMKVFDLPRYSDGSAHFLNVFRYFAKLLCCQVADCDGPRSNALTRFATGASDQNPVFLSIDLDPTYSDWADISGDHAYAAHGGLMVPFGANDELPSGLHSTLTIGPVRYVFWVRFSSLVGLAIRIFHPAFWGRCKAAYLEALQNPLSDEQRQRLGY